MKSEYEERKLVKSQFSRLVSVVDVFQGGCSHVKTKMNYK